MDFFNLENGKNDSTNPCVHFSDGNLWFNIQLGQASIHFSSFSSLQKFCSFLEKAEGEKRFCQIERNDDFDLIALENEDEGTRNLCIYDGNLSLIFNLKIEIILGLAKFLREQKEKDNW